jgi:HEAT repeat protein
MNARQRKLAGIIAFAFVFAILAWRLLHSPEPAYNGKPLSAWAQQYLTNHWSRWAGSAAEREAEFAIQQIGTNGIPFLLELVRARDSVMKQRLRKVFPVSWWTRLDLDQTRGEMERRVGVAGLVALGTNAVFAVPHLIELASHHPMDDGPYPDSDGHQIVMAALKDLGPNAESAVPFLIQQLTNSVASERAGAALVLGKIQRRPSIVVPALIAYLARAMSLGSDEVGPAVYSIAEFGTNARPVVPTLLSLLNHSSPYVRERVTNCLPRIDAEAAAKAQVRSPP